PLAPFARSLMQMTPGSSFLARLHDGAWPAQVRLASVWSRGDGASPYPACVIQTHALPHLANVEVAADHSGLIVQKKVYEVVLRELRRAEAEAPRVLGPLTAMRGGRARSAAAGAPAGAVTDPGSDDADAA
ncbi:MAG TPA: permease, partial [Anaeromyxobacter sp.]